ncbi:head tail connector [Campylobacter phage PC10]|nr:head tail connector [Campylobacter phage PC10]
MRLKALKDSKKELIDIQELRDFLRIDSDVFDANLKQFLKAGMNEFETRTNRILALNDYEVEFFNERVILAPFNALKNANFKAEFKTNGGVLYAIGCGNMIVNLGFEELPQDIKLWLKNYVLMAFDGVSMPKISSALITRYKIVMLFLCQITKALYHKALKQMERVSHAFFGLCFHLLKVSILVLVWCMIFYAKKQIQELIIGQLI